METNQRTPVVRWFYGNPRTGKYKARQIIGKYYRYYCVSHYESFETARTENIIIELQFISEKQLLALNNLHSNPKIKNIIIISWFDPFQLHIGRTFSFDTALTTVKGKVYEFEECKTVWECL